MRKSKAGENIVYKLIFRFILRIVMLLIVLLLYFKYENTFFILEPRQFLSKFSPLHIIWGIWATNILLHLFPVPLFPLGFRKQFSKTKAVIIQYTKSEILKLKKEKKQSAFKSFFTLADAFYPACFVLCYRRIFTLRNIYIRLHFVYARLILRTFLVSYENYSYEKYLLR